MASDLPHNLASSLPTSRSLFVGRERELVALSERLVLARHGHPRVVFVAGVPGVGKTRLVMEFADRTRSEGWLVLTGRTYDSDGMLPYLAWVEALREYVRSCPAVELRRQLADGVTDVALIMPEVRSRLPDLPFRAPLRPEHDRYRLFESLSEFLVNVARSRTDAAGLLLVLDDLHWADRPTLLLLGHIARRLAVAPILIIGTYRTVDLDRRHPLSAVLADLSRERLSERVLLQSFSTAEATILIQGLTGEPAASAVVEAIYRETEGNPFFLEEVVRHLRAEGRDLADPQTVSNRWAVPEGVRQVIGSRLSRLSPVANQLLQIAAVMGDGFRFDVLSVASSVETGPLVDALEETLAAGVIREQDGRYYFTHALIRQTLEEELSAPRRAGLHRRVGQALERLHGDHPEGHLSELAHHFCASAHIEDLPRAIGYARRAAERASALLAYEEAARLVQLALQALDLTDMQDETLRIELLLALGEARRKAGELHEAMDVFQRAAEAARVLGDTQGLARAALGYEDALLPTGLPRGPDGGLSARLLDEALRTLTPGEGALRVRALAGLGRAFYFAGDGERATPLIDAAITRARQDRDASALAYALNVRCMVVSALEAPAKRLATAAELLQHAEEIGDRELALEGRRWRLYALLDMGDTTAVDAEIAAYAWVAAELRQPQYLSHVALWRAMRALMDGRFAEVEALAREMLATGRQAQRQEADFTFAYQMFVLHRDQGDLTRLAELEPMLRENAEREAAHPVRRAHLMLLQTVLGRPTEASAELERLARHDFADLARDLVWLVALAELVEVCAELGDTRRSALLYELMRPYERWNIGSNAVVSPGPVAYYLGRAAVTLGRWQEAQTHFDAAAALARRMGARPMLARTLEGHAVVLGENRDGKDIARARELLEQSLAIYEDLGMARDAARARSRLSDSRLARSTSRPSWSSGLTEREIEVLRLIAAGKSNQEIAGALSLSVRTIERHITNLYGKIDARGRADATAYAYRHQLN